MKKIISIITLLIIYNFSSFAAEHILHVPGVQTCLGTPQVRHWFKQMQLIQYREERQKTIDYYNQFPKISPEELDQWVAQKMYEIEENKAKRKQQQELEQLKYLRKDSARRNPKYEYNKCIKKSLKNDHRNRYNPKIKTITCYPPQPLLEWKK